MKIAFGTGTPVYIYERDNGSAVLMQGTSFIRLSAVEIDALIAALRPDPHQETT
jgi:hypothetical protein